jgi:beta-aspartyl-peptidase (threonine type)
VSPAPLVVIHAGAGAGRAVLAQEDRCRAVLRGALESARDVLDGGADATAAVRAAVRVLEDFELFNAGLGAALCSDGSAELSAAVMRGSDRAAGAVAALRRTRRPIDAAGWVMESHQVLLIGEHGDRFAEGGLAAATSTGGISGQPPGRVGDSPLIGAGTWADDRVAVSCTGDGEMFVRAAAAHSVATLVASGRSLAEACGAVLADVGSLGGEGGMIAVDSDGGAAMPFVTAAMPRGLWRLGQEPQVAVGAS